MCAVCGYRTKPNWNIKIKKKKKHLRENIHTPESNDSSNKKKVLFCDFISFVLNKISRKTKHPETEENTFYSCFEKC